VSTDSGREQQRDAQGRLRHLLTLDGLTRDEMLQLLDLAQFYVRFPGDVPRATRASRVARSRTCSSNRARARACRSSSRRGGWAQMS
jgi:aspartate carbamoyltransferase catalytic subunit